MKNPRFMVLTLVCLTFTSAMQAQQVLPSPKPAGPKVELSLIVTDKAKKSVNTIRKEEIRIFEGRVEQIVESVEPDNRPVDYGLIIDSSRSLKDHLTSVLEAARLIIANRRTSDEILVVRFASSEKIMALQDFTSDGSALLQSLNKIKLEDGQSAVIDAIYVSATHVAKHKTADGRRKALIIITDGEDRNSFHKRDHLVKMLREHRIQVFVLGLVVDLGSEGGFTRLGSLPKAEQLLNTVAEESGGRVFFPRTNTELRHSTLQIIGDLQSQFRINYQSSSDSEKEGFRKVDVKLISPPGEKRAAIVPRGYYVGSKDTKP